MEAPPVESVEIFPHAKKFCPGSRTGAGGAPGDM